MIKETHNAGCLKCKHGPAEWDEYARCLLAEMRYDALLGWIEEKRYCSTKNQNGDCIYFEERPEND